MFYPTAPAQVYIAPGATDMRKSINGLSLLVVDQLELNPLSGHLFAFCNRKRDMVKILYWDRNGFCLYAELGIKTRTGCSRAPRKGQKPVLSCTA